MQPTLLDYPFLCLLSLATNVGHGSDPGTSTIESALTLPKRYWAGSAGWRRCGYTYPYVGGEEDADLAVLVSDVVGVHPEHAGPPRVAQDRVISD
jgi:hypothetical protein